MIANQAPKFFPVLRVGIRYLYVGLCYEGLEQLRGQCGSFKNGKRLDL
jgi:hypothetical protein